LVLLLSLFHHVFNSGKGTKRSVVPDLLVIAIVILFLNLRSLLYYKINLYLDLLLLLSCFAKSQMFA
jgi:hypothetical protein